MEHHQQPLVLDKTTLKFHRGKGEDTTGGFNTRVGMEAGLRTRLVGSLPGGVGWDGVPSVSYTHLTLPTTAEV